MEVSVLNLGSVILLLHAFSSSWDFTNRRLSIFMLDFLLPMMLSQTNPNCNLGTLNGKRQLYVLPTIGIPIIQSITIPWSKPWLRRFCWKSMPNSMTVWAFNHWPENQPKTLLQQNAVTWNASVIWVKLCTMTFHVKIRGAGTANSSCNFRNVRGFSRMHLSKTCLCKKMYN